jgi:hypothetical protein
LVYTLRELIERAGCGVTLRCAFIDSYAGRFQCLEGVGTDNAGQQGLDPVVGKDLRGDDTRTAARGRRCVSHRVEFLLFRVHDQEIGRPAEPPVDVMQSFIACLPPFASATVRNRKRYSQL